MNFLDNKDFVPKYTSKDYTQREITFVNLLCDYNNTIEGAYRDAYKVKSGTKAKHAWKVYKQEHIQELLFIRRCELIQNANINFQTQIMKLEEIRYIAMQEGKLDIALKAIDKINGMLGWTVQKVIDTPKVDSVVVNYVVPKVEDQKTIDITENINNKQDE